MANLRGLAAVFTALSLALAACTHPSGEQYTAGDVGRIVDTGQATVISSRTVDIKGGENRGIGAVAGGAAAGSVAAAAVDKPGAEAAAAIIAGLAGAGLGWLIEEEARSRGGIEYVLRMDDGRVITLVQNRAPDEQPIAPGSDVLIQYGRDYTRVVPVPAGADVSSSRTRDTRDYNGLDTGRGVPPEAQPARNGETAAGGNGQWSDPDAE
jgi:outer membrane lipoprotein SlyB